jgi:hypothetical protein
VNEKQLILIRGVMDSINATLEMYEKDATHAPADWILENWWHTLEAVITSSSSPFVETLIRKGFPGESSTSDD